MSQITQTIHDGCLAVIEPTKNKRRKFWQELQGKRCIVISHHRNAAIVEVPELKELRICRIEDLRLIRLS